MYTGGGAIAILLAAAFVCDASENETRTLPNANTLSTLVQSLLQQQQQPVSPSTTADFFAQQFPFQQLLSSPQFGNLLALLYNLSQSQSPNNPQSGQQSLEGDNYKHARVQRVLRPSNPSFPNNMYTTLPFNDLNLTEFSWLWGDMSANGNGSDNQKNKEGMSTQQKLFGGGGNTTYADLNFVPFPQLLNLFGR